VPNFAINAYRYVRNGPRSGVTCKLCAAARYSLNLHGLISSTQKMTLSSALLCAALASALLAQPPAQTFVLKGPGVQAREDGLAAVAGGRYAEAVPLLERAIRSPPTRTAGERQAAATAENALGGAFKALGRHNEALAAFRRALALLDGSGALLDEATVESNLGAVLADTGRPKEAEARYSRALRTLDAAVHADDEAAAAEEGDELTIAHARARADVLNNMADLRHGAGRLEEAHALHARALALRERALGARHGDLASSLNNVAVLLLDLRRHDEAVKLLRRAAKISKTAAGAKHPQHATALANLGGALTQLGRHSDARSYLQRAVAINTAALGDAHESTRGAVANLKACEAAIEQQQQRQSTG
jgi:tetratricopeptide (TPR) repeat protein